jgi:hypothetical protein
LSELTRCASFSRLCSTAPGDGSLIVQKVITPLAVAHTKQSKVR